MKPANLLPVLNGMGGVLSVKAFPLRHAYCRRNCVEGERRAQTASGSGRGSVRCWLLALFGPVAVRVKAAVPVVPGLVASVAGGDDAPSQFEQQLLGGGAGGGFGGGVGKRVGGGAALLVVSATPATIQRVNNNGQPQAALPPG